MCDCNSYNWEIGSEPCKLIIDPYTKRNVCIDACIVDDILKLWVLGISTLSSCCGHNRLIKSIVFGSKQLALSAHRHLDGYAFLFWSDEKKLTNINECLG